MSIVDIKKGKKKMRQNTMIRKADKDLNTMDGNSAISYIPLDLQEDHLVGHINKNLFELEENVAFFSFAIKEIEEIIK